MKKKISINWKNLLKSFILGLIPGSFIFLFSKGNLLTMFSYLFICILYSIYLRCYITIWDLKNVYTLSNC